jgi:adenosylmethionine-8-amino-7-oxononanoate aminotransferase
MTEDHGSAPTGETTRLQRLALDHLWMAYQPPVPFEADGGPRVIVAAEGTWMVDSEGRRYLDGVSALEACVAGHIRPELADVAYRQMQQLEFLDVFRYASPPAIELAARLAEITPGDLARVHFTPGGSEAVETAIKIAKQYHWLRDEASRYKVITREGAYHGCTFGAMAVDGEYFGTRIHLRSAAALWPALSGTLSLPLPALRRRGWLHPGLHR